MQAAIAAHTYDPTTPNRTPTPGTSFTTPDDYAHYWTNGAPCYFNGVTGAGTYVNFFNTNDWALTLLWKPDQDLKPDVGFSSYAGNFWEGTNQLQFPANTYLIFPYCDQAPCNALGAQGNVAGAFAYEIQIGSVTIPIYQQQDLAAPPDNFGGQHKYHSGEFRSDNMSRGPVWNQMLEQMHLK
jgi:hypothetical protein